MEVQHIATGFVLIQRDVIQIMMDTFSDKKYIDTTHFLSSRESEFAYALFESGVVNGHYLSEDWMFCSLWTTHFSGKVFVDVTIELTHIGPNEYSGAFVNTIV